MAEIIIIVLMFLGFEIIDTHEFCGTTTCIWATRKERVEGTVGRCMFTQITINLHYDGLWITNVTASQNLIDGELGITPISEYRLGDNSLFSHISKDELAELLTAL